MRFSLLVSLLASLVFAGSALGATLVATIDQAIYQEGDLVTITLVGTTIGAGPGISEPPDLATHIDVRIVGTGFTDVSTDTGLTGTCVYLSFCIQGQAYVVGYTQGTSVASNYIAFSQIGYLVPVAQTAGMMTTAAGFPPGTTAYSDNGVLNAVFTTTAGPPGTYPIEMSDVGIGFFGIAGPQTLGSYTVVSEPTTAALMGLGLLALSMRRRG